MKPISMLLPALLILGGCAEAKRVAKSSSPVAPSSLAATLPAAHAHGVGPSGGVVFELGKYHAEFTVDHEKKQCRLLMLSADETNPKPIIVAANELMLTIKETRTKDGKVIPRMTIQLLPSTEKSEGTIFVGSDPTLGTEASFSGMVAGMIDGKPSQGEFKEGDEHAHATPAGNVKEQDLFLKPGGLYTMADIEKNGKLVPSAKFKDMSWAHEDDLKPGDKICPVTYNKADAQCVWYVNGKAYEFCCPPCLEKFVKWAKSQPDKIKPPESYVK